MTLHILKSDLPLSLNAIGEFWSSDDVLVIIQNGCLLQSQVKDLLPANANIFVLSEHSQNRGVAIQFQGIEMKDFAQLSASTENSITW